MSVSLSRTSLRDAPLDHHVAAAESQLGEARRLERRLNVHAVIHHVGDKLRVRLRLVQAAHDAEADVDVVLLHEGRNDGVERALARRERIRTAPDPVRTAPPRLCRWKP